MVEELDTPIQHRERALTGARKSLDHARDQLCRGRNVGAIASLGALVRQLAPEFWKQGGDNV